MPGPPAGKRSPPVSARLAAMEQEAVDGFSNMSKSAILRVVIAEKLTTAAQEILAVVERIVAGYEEEASGLRQEIDRQRRQLEALLQPEIKLERTDDQQLFPICELLPGEASGGGGELPEEQQQQHKIELSVEYDGSVGLLCYTAEQTRGEGEDEAEEEEESSERSALTHTQGQDHLPELGYDVASRFSPPTVQSDRRSAGGPLVSEPRSHMDLRVCILEDSQIEVLSAKVFQKYLVQELQCPRGLQEADFLDLLRSSFPQLAAEKPFDVFLSDRSRTLQPLRVQTLTPEEIDRSIRSSGAGNSVLYIRLKAQEEPEATEELHPSQRKEAAADWSSSPAPTRQHTGMQPHRRKRRRHRSSEPHSHVDLRIRILEDTQADVLSVKVLKKHPEHQLQCPCGLQEAEFLDLLTSTFPQLAAEKPFDLFTSDRGRKLHPLKVETLTPEEIDRSIRSSGAGNSALYIRPKAQEEPEATEELHPSQRKEAAADWSSSPAPTRQHTGMQPHRRKRRRHRSSEPHSHVDLRIRILEDTQADVLSVKVLKKHPEHQLQCPCGLQEAEFLDLLTSTFPQLAAEKPFDLFTSDRGRKLHPLKVETLTPEEIDRSIRSSGAGNSALYIRPKPLEQLQSATCDQTSPNTSVQSDRRCPGRPQLSEPQNHIKLRVRLLEDSQINMLSARVLRKYPEQELQCPCGLQEADFLDLLRTSFPQLAADKPFDVFTADRSRALQPLVVKTLTPEEISRRTKFFSHSFLYLRLKAPEEAQSGGEKLQLLQRKTPTRQNRSSVQQEGSRVDFLFSCSTTKQQNMDAEEADDEDCERSTSPRLWSLQSLLLSESERDEEEVNDGDDDWKPEKTDESLRVKEPEKTAGRKRAERSGVQRKRKQICLPGQVLTGGDSDAHLSCKVCRAPRGSTAMLIKHSWSHMDDPERLCGVCGERSESAEQLWSHLQSHQKSHSCKICGKSFLSTCGLNGHTARHKGEKPYKCKICLKAFTLKSTLTNHMWVHTVDKPYKCDICQTSSESKVKMRFHRLRHTGDKPYSCSMCTKPFCSPRTLSQHMLTHSGHTGDREKPYVCQVCSKSFYSNQQLQSHLRSHSIQRPNSCSKCKKHFTCKAKLMAHMRVHTL